MLHIWLRAESKPFERRVALAPAAARKLVAAGFTVSIEECGNRVFDIRDYRQSGCRIVPYASWQDAPPDCYILGLKELAEPLPALRHRHTDGRVWQRALELFAEKAAAAANK